MTEICAICLENQENPIELMCKHLFCMKCIGNVANSRNETFPCPLCRENQDCSIHDIQNNNYNDEYDDRDDDNMDLEAMDLEAISFCTPNQPIRQATSPPQINRIQLFVNFNENDIINVNNIADMIELEADSFCTPNQPIRQPTSPPQINKKKLLFNFDNISCKRKRSNTI